MPDQEDVQQKRSGHKRKQRSFWARVSAKITTLDPVECWIFTGATVRSRNSDNRYPVVKDEDNRQVVLTREMLRRYVREPEPGEEAGHCCPVVSGIDTRCVNVAHLKWVSRIENERMKRDYGRV